MAHPKILVFILAGGKGERLFPLTVERSKPAVPFGGSYRIVDFVLSNFINSHIFSIYLLVQYKSQSLIEHVRENWVLSPVVSDHFVTVIPPQMRMGQEWFQGTADAVFQNLNVIRRHKPGLVAVFGADHIYRMDIRQMVDFHLENRAFATVAARPVLLSEASAFGVIVTEVDGCITGFEEKPKQPMPMPTDPERAYVSTGNYLFNTDVLINAVADAQKKKQHDFGRHVLPSLVDTAKLYAYDFAKNKIPGIRPCEEEGYWRDIGTIKAYWDAHKDILGPTPLFELNNEQWPIHPAHYVGPAAKILHGDIINSYIAEGTLINNATVRNSVLRRGVVVEDNVEVSDSIVMDHVVIKQGCRIRNAIIDRFSVVEEDVQIGYDIDVDRWRLHVDACGIAIVPRGHVVRSELVKATPRIGGKTIRHAE